MADRTRDEILHDLHETEKAGPEIRDLDLSKPENRERMERVIADHAKYGAELRAFDAEVEKVKGAEADREAFVRAMNRSREEPEIERALDAADDDPYGDAVLMGAAYDPDGKPYMPEISRSRSKALAQSLCGPVDAPETRRANEMLQNVAHKRVIVAGTAAQGGNAVPEDTSQFRMIQREMLAFGGVEKVSRVVVTANGRTLPVPTVDDTATDFETATTPEQTAQNVAENTQMGAAKRFDFGQVEFGAHVISTGQVGVSRQAIEDWGPSYSAFLLPAMAERLARRKAQQLAAGTGVGEQLRGILVAAPAVTAAGVASLVWDVSDGAFTSTPDAARNLPVALQHVVDPAYRMGPRAAIVMHDNFLFALKSLKGSDGHYILPYLRMAEWQGQERIGTFRIVIDQNYDDLSAGNDRRVATVGDHGSFWIRRVRGMWTVRDMTSPDAANYNRVLYYLSERCDSNVVRTNAIRRIEFNSVA